MGFIQFGDLGFCCGDDSNEMVVEEKVRLLCVDFVLVLCDEEVKLNVGVDKRVLK